MKFLPLALKHRLAPQFDALARAGVEPTGWRVLLTSRSSVDFVIDADVHGVWQRVEVAAWSREGLRSIRHRVANSAVFGIGQ